MRNLQIAYHSQYRASFFIQQGHSFSFLMMVFLVRCDVFPSLNRQTLEALLQEQQTPEERGAEALRDKGYGPTSALANLRLFDSPEGTGARDC